MKVERVADGLWRWTARHEEWNDEVGCIYVEADDAICLIDPLVPHDDRERFFDALDRDVERLGLPVHVLLTVYWHTRSARELSERYGAPIWAHAKAERTVGRRIGPVDDLFEPGDRLPGGVEAILGRFSEVVYWLPAHRAVVTGDVIIGAPGGGVRFCPPSWTPRGGGPDRWRENLRTLLDLPVERVLVSHGEPVLEHGSEALRTIL